MLTKVGDQSNSCAPPNEVPLRRIAQFLFRFEIHETVGSARGPFFVVIELRFE